MTLAPKIRNIGMKQDVSSSPGSSEPRDLKKQVELRLYQRDVEDIIIHHVKAKLWEDIIIVPIHQANDDAVHKLAEYFKQALPDKKVLIVPDDWDIDFYGVETYDPSTATEVDG
jgi:hypothetical protein